MVEPTITEASGRPMSYEDLVTRQLDRIAVDIGDPTKTILNVLILEAFTTIDRMSDTRYDKEIDKLDTIWKFKKKNAYDLVTKRDDSSISLRLEYMKAIATIEPVMKCLKRAGRFPARFGLLDEAEREVSEGGSLQVASGDGVETDTAE